MNKMIGVNLFTNKFLRNSLRIIAIMCIFSALIISSVSAEDNDTIVTTSEDVGDTYYRDTAQYEADYAVYYQQYKDAQDNEIISNLRSIIYNYLVDSSLTWEEKQNIILPLMGWDYRLEYYMDKPDKYTVNETTGIITWDLGVLNWWAKLFGAGIQESTLPQNIAEGDALYQIYCENYEEYVDALREAGDP